MKQRSARDAPALRLVIELAQIEIRIETTFEHCQPRPEDVKHGGSKHAAEQAPEHHTFDKQRADARRNRFDHDIGRQSKTSGLPWVRLVSRGRTDAHRASGPGWCAAP